MNVGLSSLPGRAALAALLVATVALAAIVLGGHVGQASTTYTVNSTADPGVGVCDATECTLREAIHAANSSGGTDTIKFNIPGAGPHTISPSIGLPAIYDPVIIDGTSEPDFAGSPIVELDGSGAPYNIRGLAIWAGSSTVRGLVISGWDTGISLEGNGGNTVGGTTAGAGNVISGNHSSGVYILGSGATGNEVQGNYIGTDANGTADLGNADGVLIEDAPNNFIGGMVAGARNVISGNHSSGVYILGSGATGNLVEGNYIGTDVNGTAALGNDDGVYIEDAPNNTIGGTVAGARNIISGNGTSGVEITDSGATGNVVEGNYIGTDVNGTADLGNAFYGVLIKDAPSNTIGGTVAGARNIISGNGASGVGIDGSGGSDAYGNEVQGNYIGTDVNGTAALGNSVEGVSIYVAVSNTIGGTLTGARNVISGNDGDGVRVWGSGATGNVVLGNYIGTDKDGTAALGNGGDGVLIYNVPINFIGGTVAGARNVISGNGASGVYITGSGATGIRVRGNYIGTDVNGAAALGNSSDGVRIDNAPTNSIGGTLTGERNIISGNGADGVGISGGAATGNQVQGNYIGTDVNGTADLGNSADGVLIQNAPSNTIGGTTAGERNIISKNAYGVVIEGSGATGNVVLGNYIGTDVNGTTALGNKTRGVYIDNAPSNTVGGTTAGARNVISDSGPGVEIWGSGATGNLVQGNYIGTDKNGTADLGNAYGVFIQEAPDNTIGGTVAGARNIISGNDQDGVFIDGSGATGNLVQGNYIGTDVNGTAALGNSWWGVSIQEAPDNTVGGTTAGARNVISGNDHDGVNIWGSGATGNLVQGNYIGTDANGTAALGNHGDGVYIIGAPSNTIGGTVAGARNVISGNNAGGVRIAASGATGNRVEGNYIGTDKNGIAALGNGTNGVVISDAPSNTIGGTAPGAGNVISGNGADGLFIAGSGAMGNKVLGNYIGTDKNGTADRGNAYGGVMIEAPNNTIGGTVAGARNVISGNDEDGIRIYGSDATGNVVQGNYIGTDVNGTGDLGNTLDGVHIEGAPSNTIGGTTAGERNVISGNGDDGVSMYGSGATGNQVEGNYIGTDKNGTAALANSYGVSISHAPSNTIGGTVAGAGNLISGNVMDGVVLLFSGATGNLVQGNYIGTDKNGTADLGNFYGVYIYDAPSNTIGGTASWAGNVISGNDKDGVKISGSGATGNQVQGNYIGTDRNGTADLGNGTQGVIIVGAANNTVGGTAAGARNVISGNDMEGVGIDLGDATGNLVQGNYIGTDKNGTGSLGNGFVGVIIHNAPSNTIGGTVAEARNIISGNGWSGVRIVESDATGNQVQGNYIGTDVSGAGALGNGFAGVEISGAPSNTVGGTTTGARNVISGNDVDGVIIRDSGATGNQVQGNYIGTDKNGTADLGNGGDGVWIYDATNNTVGGTVAGAGNLISGNVMDGVVLLFSGATGNLVQGNYIGTDVNGAAALGNFYGVYIYDAPSNTVGGTVAGARNVISGNFSDGVEISGSGATGNLVQGNYVGTDEEGTGHLGNLYDGVRIEDAPRNTIGGTVPEARNVISGNDHDGVDIWGSGAAGNLVQGNYIGTDRNGTAALGNVFNGVLIEDAPRNTIGGTVAETRNVISGNGASGVEITSSGAAGNQVQGNYIGTDVNGTAALGNGTNGVFIQEAPDNTVGGTTVEERNIISGNLRGVRIKGSGASGNQVQGNYIGTDVNGTGDLGNRHYGVYIDDAPSNAIGGTMAGAGNLISGNDIVGVEIYGSGATGNLVQSNYIGTDVNGTAVLGNFYGVDIYDAPNNTIGGTVAGERNIISGNDHDGVDIWGSGATGNLVQGNYIGTDVNGTADLGNFGDGVLIDEAPSNTIGGTVAGARNVISGNEWHGVDIRGSGATGNQVQGNYIGTDVNGTAALGNSTNGVMILDAPSNTIGGTTAGAGNVIAFNVGDGVFVESGTGNLIDPNSIYSNGGLGIDLGTNGVIPNDAGDPDSGANNLQNFPVLTSANQGSTDIEGSLNSTANTQFTIDFFSNTACDPSDHGEGETSLGSTTVVTDGTGNKDFTVSFGTTVPVGRYITATATDPNNNTSEFSECIEVCPSGGCPTHEADVKIVDQCFVDPPTEMDVSVDTPVTLRKVLHNNGPYTDPVTVTVTKTATAPADCSINPPSYSEQVVLPFSVDVVLDEAFTIHCSKASSHTFTVANLVSGPKEPHTVDPDPSNNEASTDLTVAAIDKADVKIVSQSFVSPPTEIDVSANVPVTLRKHLHNNGPFGPVQVSISPSAVAPPDCTATPAQGNPTSATLPASVDTVVDEVWTIHCSKASSHTITFNDAIAVISPHVTDPVAGNNSRSTQLTVAAIGRSDAKVVSVSVTGPTTIDVSTNVDITVRTTLQNSVYGPVAVTLEYSGSAPPDCSVATVGTAQVVLPVGQLVDDHTWTIHCSEPSSHTFSFTTAITTVKSPHVLETNLGNNSASGTFMTNAIAYADMKVVSQFVENPPAEIPVSENVLVTLDKVLHNNGPYGPVEAVTDTDVTAPAGCTVLPKEHIQQFHNVPVSVDILHHEPFTIHCSTLGLHTFTFDDEVGLKDPHLRDLVSNNAAQTKLTVDSVAKADVKITGASFVSPPTKIPLAQDVDVTLRKHIHNNGPRDPVDISINSTASAPTGCTIVPKTVPTSISGVPVSVGQWSDEVWTINCIQNTIPKTFVFNVSIDVSTAYVSDPNLANNAVHKLLTVKDDPLDPGADTDADGWTNGEEVLIGTDPLDACPDDTSDDAWPPDTDNTGSVSITDVLLYKPVLVGPYNPRYDLNASDTINIMDVLLYKPVLGASCGGP
jgi:CSLREA domain-containing protein